MLDYQALNQSMISINKEGRGRSDEQPVPYVYLLAFIACLNSTNLGYDIGSVGGASVLMRDQLNWTRLQTEWFVALANFIAVGGAMIAPILCDKLGRRKTFTISCVVFVSGLLLVVMSPSFMEKPYVLMMIGRVFTGLGIGLGLAIDPLYIAEISPPKFRGQLVSMSEFAINFGILLGMAADFALLGLPEGTDWRLMLGIGLILPSILFTLTLTIMPESPRWLLANGFHDDAELVLRKTHRPDENVEESIREIKAQIEFDADVAKEGWKPILSPSDAVKRMLLAGVGLGACQQVNGSEAFIYYSPSLLEKAGFESRQQTFGFTLLIGCCKTAAIFVGALLVDSWGRRPLIFLSTGLMSFFLLLIALAFPGGDLEGSWQTGVCIFAMCAFLASFSIGMGPVCWTGATEVFPLHIRAKALSLATSSNRLVSALVAGTTLTLSEALTTRGFFVFYAFMTLGSMAYLYHYFPETKGHSLEEITALFTGKALVLDRSSKSENMNPLQEDSVGNFAVVKRVEDDVGVELR